LVELFGSQQKFLEIGLRPNLSDPPDKSGEALWKPVKSFWKPAMGWRSSVEGSD
jgi:hypothetical protein